MKAFNFNTPPPLPTTVMLRHACHRLPLSNLTHCAFLDVILISYGAHLLRRVIEHTWFAQWRASYTTCKSLNDSEEQKDVKQRLGLCLTMHILAHAASEASSSGSCRWVPSTSINMVRQRFTRLNYMLYSSEDRTVHQPSPFIVFVS
eukprot:1709974-Amphidinium_carterae.1